MSEMQSYNPIYNVQTGNAPLYNYENNASNNLDLQNKQSNSGINPNYTSQIYTYPSASLYNSPGQNYSGVNIRIYNPSGAGGSCAYPNAAENNNTMTVPVTNVMQQPLSSLNLNTIPAQTLNTQQNVQQPAAAANLNPVLMNEANTIAPKSANNIDNEKKPDSSIANTPISDTNQNTQNQTVKSGKTKKIVKLSDDYIKTLESYLKDSNKDTRKAGILEVIKRFEEDDSRYDDPALNALLNIALQDPTANNRLLAMSVIAGGNAHGDKNTIELLKNLQNSKEINGQEAQMATEALLNAIQTKETVPDYSPDLTDAQIEARKEEAEE